MPFITQWIEPDIFTVHRGVTIYHTYKDDEAANGPSRYWFTTSIEDYEADYHFDVRTLKVPARKEFSQHRPLTTNASQFTDRESWGAWTEWQEEKSQIIREIIHQAIEASLLKNPDPDE